MRFRAGNRDDLEQIMALGLRSWSQFKDKLSPDHWSELFNSLNDIETYTHLFEMADCLICEDDKDGIVGMVFLVPRGNPNEIYEESWCHLRFVSVDPQHRGRGIGKKLTRLSMDLARKNKETVMALHTSEIMVNARYIYEKLGFKIRKEIGPRLGTRYWLYTIDLNDF